MSPTAIAISAQAPAKGYTAPRTPWGHPDLQGTYSNDDETGTPMERPAQFEGKRQEDLTPEEFAKLVKDRNDAFNRGVEGTEFAGGLRPPTHLIFDSFERKNKRAWLVVDPPDGRIPALTDEARKRPRVPGGVSTNANPDGPFNSWLDMGLYDRCITRGIPASMMPAGYGSYYAIVQSPDSVAIRYEMIHETRVVPFDRRPRRVARHQAVSRRRARLVGGRHARGRDAKLSRGRPRRSGQREGDDDRALHRRLDRPRGVARDVRRPHHLDAALDLHDAAHQGGRVAGGPRIRLP